MFRGVFQHRGITESELLISFDIKKYVKSVVLIGVSKRLVQAVVLSQAGVLSQKKTVVSLFDYLYFIYLFFTHVYPDTQRLLEDLSFV